MKEIENLNIKLFADGANLSEMLEMYSKTYIKGLTTNPTLMRKAGITNYKKFAQEALSHIKEKPISFEVFSDELEGMKQQALEIASWGENVYVKIPITNTQGISTLAVIDFLANQGVKVNVTAIMTAQQVEQIMSSLNEKTSSYISVFAGRIADTGRNPVTIVQEIVELMSSNKLCEIIWASPRELLNIYQADATGCHIITATDEILRKIPLIGKNLEEYSLETVKMFYTDAVNSEYNF
jgi:transaldolase